MKLRFAIRLVMTRADYALLFPTAVPIYWLSVYSGELRPVSAWLNLEPFSKDRPEPFYNSYLVTITATERQAILESPDYFACSHLVFRILYSKRALWSRVSTSQGKQGHSHPHPSPTYRKSMSGKTQGIRTIAKTRKEIDNRYE